MPGNIEIEAILKKMGKTRPEQELNCGACGYNTCREKAIAVYQGKAEISMCLPYLLGKAQSFSDTIINNTPNGILVLNESLEIQQINAAARKIVNVKHTSEVLGKQVIRILDPRVFIDVMQSGRGVRDERVYLAEYGKYVDQTVLYDRNYHIIMCIMRDVTDEMNEHLKGRGAYLCPDPACLAKAKKKKALERCFEQPVPAEVYDALAAQLADVEKEAQPNGEA